MKGKKIIIFDLDGTLVKSKVQVDDEMAALLRELLEIKHVVVITGGRYEQARLQCADRVFATEVALRNLSLFPACGTCFYRYSGGWTCVYRDILAKRDRETIRDALLDSFSEAGFVPAETPYGEIIQDLETQITFSALGADAPLHLKESWDLDNMKRKRIVAALKKRIPQFEFLIGGTTTINITDKGIDKAYGIAQIEKHLGFSKPEMLFVGDALFPGGNDYPVKAVGVDCIEVTGPEDTKRLIQSWL